MASVFLSQLQLVSKDELTRNTGCALCLNMVPALAVRLICGHVIGADCINKWLIAGRQNGCPKCGYPLYGREDDELVGSASGVARVDARPVANRDQHTIDSPSQVDRSYFASIDTPLDAQQDSGYGYVAYRPVQSAQLSSESSEALYQSPYRSPPPNRPSETAKITAGATRTTTNARQNAFIPSDFGLPPPMVRHCLATLASPPRTNQTSLPASLMAGEGRNIQNMYHPNSSTAPRFDAQGSLPNHSLMAWPKYSPSNYIPYRPGSYSSVQSLDDAER